MLVSIETLKVKFTALLTVISTGLNSKLDKTAAAVSADKLTEPFQLNMTGDVIGSGQVPGDASVDIAMTLKDSGVAGGTYTKVTVDAKGRVIDASTLGVADIPTLPISKISALATTLDAKVDLTDPRLEDSREWVGATVGQVEAEAGTATVRRAWTAQRIRQAIAAWWVGSDDKVKLDGIAPGATANASNTILLLRSNHIGLQPISTVAGLQAALDATFSSSGGTVSGPTVFSNTANATSATTGAVRTNGGLGVALDIYAGGNITAYSDIRKKGNIRQIEGALEKLQLVRGVTYDRLDSGRREAGMIAQEWQQVLPEVVLGDENGLSLAYGNSTALIVEAVKELHDKLTAEIQQRDQALSDLKTELERVKSFTAQGAS